jgi:hypothetical protein
MLEELAEVMFELAGNPVLAIPPEVDRAGSAVGGGPIIGSCAAAGSKGIIQVVI